MATDNNRAVPLATAANTATSSNSPKFRVHIGEQDCQFTVGRGWAELIVQSSTAHTVLVNSALVEAVFAPKSKTINFKVSLEVKGGLEVVGFINYFKHDLVQRNLSRKGAEVSAKLQAELAQLQAEDVTEVTSKVDREEALAALLG